MDSNDDMAADMAMMWTVTWQSHVTWQQQHSPQVDGPNSEWATKLDLIFNPFIRIVITAQNTYQIVRPFPTASNQIQYLVFTLRSTSKFTCCGKSFAKALTVQQVQLNKIDMQ